MPDVKKHVFLILIFLFTGGGASSVQAMGSVSFAPEGLEKYVTIRSSDGQTHEFSVELALTKSEHRQGLMHRTELPEYAGMLFVFNSDKKRRFWMRNTLIPLDIIFIEQDGRIQHIHHQAKPQDDTNITSPGKVRAVLEINGGLSEKLGIKVGDTVFHSAFRNLHLLEGVNR